MLRIGYTRRLAALAGAMLVASGLAVVTGQASALAAESEAICRSSEYNNPNPPYAHGACTNTTKYYRVIADCEENSGRTYLSYGNITRNGGGSRAYCATNGVALDSWMQIQD